MLFLLGCLSSSLDPSSVVDAGVEVPIHTDIIFDDVVSSSSFFTETMPHACEEGRVHWEYCFDFPLSPSLECTPSVEAEYALIASLSCTDLEGALWNLPLCETLGIGCPDEVDTCAETPLDAHAYRQILALSDASTLDGMEDVVFRIASIREVFASHGDLRGAFASVYAPITEKAAQSIYDGLYTYPQWARDVVVFFSIRYFDNLRASLLNQHTTQSWGRFYDLTQDCSVTPLRIAAHGIMVHLVVDLPHTLVDVSSHDEHRDDFVLFGDALVQTTPLIVDNLRADYGIESEAFFQGFFLGDWVDSISHEGAMTTFVFQSIRNKAWTNGMWLQDWRYLFAETEIYSSWRSADGILATWDLMQDE